jgi:hypothetical protein
MTSCVAHGFFIPCKGSTVVETKKISTGKRHRVENTSPNAKMVTSVAKNSVSYLFWKYLVNPMLNKNED